MLTWGRGGRGRRSAPVIDPGYLARLEAHIGRETLRELLADGLIEIADRIAGLERAVAEGARAEALRIGHDLAGLAGHLGLSALSLAAVEMNRAARGAPEAPLAAGPVLEAGRAAEAALRERLAEPA